MTTKNSVYIVGAACRLPGAENETALLEVLENKTFTVSPFPEGRWNPSFGLHPDPKAPGYSYTYAGGFLSNPFDFDVNVFGISPREIAQIDPQQRLLAEVVWEALENACIAPSSIAGTEVGVYVGVSALDYANLVGGDPAAIGSHFMTGNTLSVVANRISYLFDLRGPSLVIDTACSSSLVALDRAMADIAAGRIDTAIVAGVNMLLSPASFIGFSRASMLSPTGVCRPFSADGDGYVRGEGAVAFVLRRADLCAEANIRAVISGTAVNSDGRTNGIALPGLDGQISLLERVYGDAGIMPADLAFVEAHGTGTRAGDPIEARALGSVLGSQRQQPLPIGSLKSNIGHLEPASGVAGMMKAILAFETRSYPATLHLDRLNPDIPFDELNLRPAATPVDLGSGKEQLHCGVSSFGFGGTNAHVILSSAPSRPSASATVEAKEADGQLVISAGCQDALRSLSASHAASLEHGIAPVRLAHAVASGRQLMRHRAVVPLDTGDRMARALSDFAATGKAPGVETGVAARQTPKVCFVYSGNGAQWVGMGRSAYRGNAAFAEAFNRVDIAMQDAGLVSIRELLFAEDLAERIGMAAAVQPLLFGVQAALTAALIAAGLEPDAVLGHSLGETAGAYAAGAIDLDQAAQILAARTRCQGGVYGKGGMAVLAASRSNVADLLSNLAISGLGIAADNGPSSVTISGTKVGVADCLKAARRARIAGRKLDIDYPFHSHLLDDVRETFIKEIGELEPKPNRIPLYSTVTGRLIEDDLLGTDYWWHNIRSEVLFRQAVQEASRAGYNLFVEIGPRPIMTSAITSSVEEAGLSARVIHTLSEADDKTAGPGGNDPIAGILARAIANGVNLHLPESSVSRFDEGLPLPSYPWQRRTYRHEYTTAAIDIHGNHPRHPLIGARLAQDAPEWRTVLDAGLLPLLADHVVGEETVVPAAALAEMILAAAHELSPEGPWAFEDFDVAQAMVIPVKEEREVSIRHSTLTNSIEIYTRPRLRTDDWTLCARARLAPASSLIGAPPAVGEASPMTDMDALYAKADNSGIHYGERFRLLRSVRRNDEELIEVELAAPQDMCERHFLPYMLHPASLDAAFHGLFDCIAPEADADKAWVPIRFERLQVWKHGTPIRSATIVVESNRDHLKIVTLWLRDEKGMTVAKLSRALLRQIVLSRQPEGMLYHSVQSPSGSALRARDIESALANRFAARGPAASSSGTALLRAHMWACAHRDLLALTDADGALDIPRLVSEGRMAIDSTPLAHALIEELNGAGLVTWRDDMPIIASDAGLPPSEVILATFAREFPLASTDLLLSAQAEAELASDLQTGHRFSPRAAVTERHEVSALHSSELNLEVLHAILDVVERAAPNGLHVAVYADGAFGLMAALAQEAQRATFRLTVIAEHAAAIERIARRLPSSSGLDFLDLSLAQEPAAADIVVAITHSANDLVQSELVQRLATVLPPEGVMLIGSWHHGILHEFQLGAEASADAVPPKFPARHGSAGSSECLEHFASHGGEEHGFSIRFGCHARSSEAKPANCLFRAIHADKNLQLAIGGALNQVEATGPSATDSLCLVGGDTEDLSKLLAGLRDAVLDLRTRPTDEKFWIVCGAKSPPLQTALMAFARVAMNEMMDHDIRLIEVAPETPPETTAMMLAEILASPGSERSYRLAQEGLSVLRVLKGLPRALPLDSAEQRVTLDFAHAGVLDSVQWVGEARRKPGPHEVEIEVMASGLNFRDVMLATGLLNDDVVEEGDEGHVYGLECAGKVVAIGEHVTRYRPGDMVMGFAWNCFATHSTAHEQSLVPLPSWLSPEAGAGIPVAFLTAWYSLVEMARLKPGERVLIHGGAGGVGLAAIQVARAVGAEVIATVSTPDKAAVARLFGAQHILNSRSLDFADHIRHEMGGVDVVLNSLSGEAMQASLRCLRPRGRFVELGKRDYVANTVVGMRTFRRNISYFGVDIDQIVMLDSETMQRGMDDVARGLEDGRYLPLPCTAFESIEIGGAFRLMQSAGHAGKIVVRPPSAPTARGAGASNFVVGDGVQLVIGGTRGFGLATALWLFEHGATTIVIASRSGVLKADDEARIAHIRARGCAVLVETVDIADLTQAEALIERIAVAHGPITGVYHTAGVLEDAMLDGVRPGTTEMILAPKVAGASNLDLVTRSQPVRQFVLFSSAAALVGNPGQSVYCAANGFLEGLARQRRAQGLPAIAMQWGAIADVGMFSERADTVSSIDRVSSAIGMQSAKALEQLASVLPMNDTLVDPVVTCANLGGELTLRSLPWPSSPSFAWIGSGRSAQGTEHSESLSEMIEGKSDAEALKILGGIVAEKIAQILRIGVQEIDLDESLDGLGMDSLMALEFRMTIETEYKVKLPVMSITSVSNLRDLAQRLLQTLRGSEDTGLSAGMSDEETQLFAMHTNAPLDSGLSGPESQSLSSEGYA